MLRKCFGLSSYFQRRHLKNISIKSDTTVAKVVKDHIVTISLSSSNGINCLTSAAIETLQSMIDSVAADASNRVLIFHSLLPDVFSYGVDLIARGQLTDEELQENVNARIRLANSIRSLPIATIAAIDGIALGGGLELALAADVRLAASSARLALLALGIASIPQAFGTQLLPRSVPVAIAKEMLFAKRVLDGPEAARFGLVNRCLPQNDQHNAAYVAAIEMANQILKSGHVAVINAKAALDDGSNAPLAAGLQFEAAYRDAVARTKDAQEAVEAFNQKRAAVFSGE